MQAQDRTRCPYGLMEWSVRLRELYRLDPSYRTRDLKEARIYSAWRAITWFGRSAALVFLQISRYLLQKPPCIPSRSKRRASTRINPRFLKEITETNLHSTQNPSRFGARRKSCVALAGALLSSMGAHAQTQTGRLRAIAVTSAARSVHCPTFPRWPNAASPVFRPARGWVCSRPTS